VEIQLVKNLFNYLSTCAISSRIYLAAALITLKMKTCQSVHFPLDVVTTISRLPNQEETYHLVRFEDHVKGCSRCIDASYAYGFSELICNKGRYFAARLLDRMLGASNGHTYSTAIRSTRYVRVEIPSSMEYVRLLYKGRRHKRRTRGILRTPARQEKWSRGIKFNVAYRT
jgi:hypothetical protein